MALISIIIVSYNSLHETTAPCLKSIFAAGTGPGEDFEVIVVDNNSSDGTVSWLTDLAEREPRLKCIFNKENRGFAGGNNDGIRVASGEFLILLNSDCIVPAGWMRGLIEPLVRDTTIGMTGPVTNQIGNEQKIHTVGTTPQEILQEGQRWVSNSSGRTFDTERLIFFCVALRRELFDRIGPLDEGFGLGFYEDDDYCARVINAGYRLVCLEDVFVYHRGGGSFDGSGVATRNIMRENRKRFEQKHGSSCSDRKIHPRDLHLRVIEGYLSAAGQGELSPDLKFAISNRLKTIESLMPKGMIKRYFFKRKLGGLHERLKARGLR